MPREFHGDAVDAADFKDKLQDSLDLGTDAKTMVVDASEEGQINVHYNVTESRLREKLNSQHTIDLFNNGILTVGDVELHLHAYHVPNTFTAFLNDVESSDKFNDNVGFHMIPFDCAINVRTQEFVAGPVKTTTEAPATEAPATTAAPPPPPPPPPPATTMAVETSNTSKFAASAIIILAFFLALN